MKHNLKADKNSCGIFASGLIHHVTEFANPRRAHFEYFGVVFSVHVLDDPEIFDDFFPAPETAAAYQKVTQLHAAQETESQSKAQQSAHGSLKKNIQQCNDFNSSAEETVNFCGYQHLIWIFI